MNLGKGNGILVLCVEKCIFALTLCVEKCNDSMISCVEKCNDSMISCVEKCNELAFLCVEKCKDMKRKIYDQLLEWKSQEHHKPLILNGVRQCGNQVAQFQAT